MSKQPDIADLLGEGEPEPCRPVTIYRIANPDNSVYRRIEQSLGGEVAFKPYPEYEGERTRWRVWPGGRLLGAPAPTSPDAPIAEGGWYVPVRVHRDSDGTPYISAQYMGCQCGSDPHRLSDWIEPEEPEAPSEPLRRAEYAEAPDA